MKKKILIYTQKQQMTVAGGAEKVFVNMANEFSRKGFEVIGACYGEEEAKHFFPLDENVRFVNLYYENLDDVEVKISKRNKFEEFLYKNILDRDNFEESKKISDKFELLLEREKPDLIISHFMHSFRECSYAKDFNLPAIVMMHLWPDIFFKFYGKKYFLINRIAINKASRMQVLFKRHIKNLAQHYFGKIKAIGNAVDQGDLNVKEAFNKDKKENIILNVSRIDKFKGQDKLIEAFSRIADKYPGWNLHIYGQFEPPEYFEVIEDLIKKYNLESRIKYLGITKKPLEAMAKSDIFVLPSSFEGFSIATAEAMSLKLPCVAFEDCDGVNDLIQHNKSGLLIKHSVDSLTECLENLITDEALRTRLGQGGLKRAQEFLSESIWKQWEEAAIEAISDYKPNTLKQKLVMFLLYVVTFFRGCIKIMFKN